MWLQHAQTIVFDKGNQIFVLDKKFLKTLYPLFCFKKIIMHILTKCHSLGKAITIKQKIFFAIVFLHNSPVLS